MLMKIQPDKILELMDKKKKKSVRVPAFRSSLISHDDKSFTLDLSHGTHVGIE